MRSGLGMCPKQSSEFHDLRIIKEKTAASPDSIKFEQRKVHETPRKNLSPEAIVLFHQENKTTNALSTFRNRLIDKTS
jgi:hypothetical protein